MPSENEIRVLRIETYKKNYLGYVVLGDVRQTLQQFRDGEWRDIQVHTEEVKE